MWPVESEMVMPSTRPVHKIALCDPLVDSPVVAGGSAVWVMVSGGGGSLPGSFFFVLCAIASTPHQWG